jgi:hypothetical protein
MKKTLLISGSIIILVGGFLAYRYYTFGKGNKGLINPTTFGFR